MTSDAHLAALAVEHGADLYSCDWDFARFKGLRWVNPPDLIGSKNPPYRAGTRLEAGALRPSLGRLRGSLVRKGVAQQSRTIHSST